MPDRTLTWAQTAALNPKTPLCISCGSELAPAPSEVGGRRCSGCRLRANVVVLPVGAPDVRCAA